MFVEYKSTQDKDGYYHEVFGNGEISSRKFKHEKSLGSWVVLRTKLGVYGLILGICLVLGVLGKLFGG